MKKILLSLSLLSSITLAKSSEPFKINNSNYKDLSAICERSTRCGFKTACTWTCLAFSTAPVGQWWKTAAVAIGAKYCGDLCENVKECKEGYYCDNF